MIEFGKVVSLQVVPFRIRPSVDADGRAVIEIQPNGADGSTRGWGVYLRHENGMAMWHSDFDHPLDAVEHAQNEIEEKYPDAFIEQSSWVTPGIDITKPHIAIVRCPGDKTMPFKIVYKHPEMRAEYAASTEAMAVEIALTVGRDNNIPIAPYRWQK